MPTLIDGFARADETPLSDGGKWQKVNLSNDAGNLILTSNHAHDVGFGASEYSNRQSSPGTLTGTDVWIETSGTYVNYGINSASVLVRFDNSENGYEIRFGSPDGTKPQIDIYKWTTGTPTSLISTQLSSLTGGTASAQVRGTAIGSLISGYARQTTGGAWTLISQVTDSAFTTGLIGIGCHNEDITKVWMEAVGHPTVYGQVI